MNSNAIPMHINPDLQTRESVQLAAGRVQFAVTAPDGETRYVRFDAKLKSDQGYIKSSLEHASHVFITEKGYGTPQLGTYYPRKKVFYSKVYDAHPHIEAINVLLEYIEGSGVPSGWTVEAESRCGMCMQRLTDPISIQRGIGPECASKPTGTKILHASAFGQLELTEETSDGDWEAERRAYLLAQKEELTGELAKIEAELAEMRAVEMVPV